MSKELDYIADLERENRILKELLYCTKRSCNNCGKVNCENFQRQRIDCCGLWVSYKDYIAELEKENAEQKEQNSHLYNDLTMTEAENAERKDQLTKAKELLKETQGYIENNDDELYDKIEQFLKEIEK